MDSTETSSVANTDPEEISTDITELPVTLFSPRFYIKLKDLVGIIIFIATLIWNINQYAADKAADKQVADTVQQLKAPRSE